MNSYTDEQLTAFLDGELPDAHMRAIERAIASNPELSVRIAALHMETGGLKALFDSWLGKAPTDKLAVMLPAIKGDTSLGGDAPSRSRSIIGYLVVAALAFGAGYFLGGL